MNSTRLQERIDRLRSTSVQRWGLVALAVVAAVSSSAVTAAVSGGSATWVVYLIAVLALAAVSEPDSLVGFAVLGVVFAQWLISNDDPTTAWAVVVALALFVFHTVLALMAVTPPAGTVHPSVLIRWLARSGFVATATLAVWAVVVVLDRSDIAGNAWLTTAAFAVVIALAAAIRYRTVASDHTR